MCSIYTAYCTTTYLSNIKHKNQNSYKVSINFDSIIPFTPPNGPQQKLKAARWSLCSYKERSWYCVPCSATPGMAEKTHTHTHMQTHICTTILLTLSKFNTINQLVVFQMSPYIKLFTVMGKSQIKSLVQITNHLQTWFKSMSRITNYILKSKLFEAKSNKITNHFYRNIQFLNINLHDLIPTKLQLLCKHA